MDRIPEFDLYRELEVDPSASRETIDAAWRSLVKRFHPDAAPDPDVAQARIRRINIAHEWLVDPERRAWYDRHRPIPADPAWRTTPPSPDLGRSGWGGSRPAPSGPEVRVPPAPPRQDGGTSPVLWMLPVAVLALVVAAIAAWTIWSGQQAPRSAGTQGTVAGTPASGGSAGTATSPDPTAVTARPSATAVNPEELLARIPDQVAGRPLAGEAAAGDEVAAVPAAASMDELAGRVGKRRSDVAFAYRAAPGTAGELLTIMAFTVRDTDGPAVLDAFIDQTKASSPGITWARASVGGRDVWTSPDRNDPSVVAYAWAETSTVFIVIANDESLAGAAIRAV